MLFSSGKQNVKMDKEIILYYPRFVAVLRPLTSRLRIPFSKRIKIIISGSRLFPPRTESTLKCQYSLKSTRLIQLKNLQILKYQYGKFVKSENHTFQSTDHGFKD